MRLDELLIADNTVAEAFVREALDYQRICGGRLESHLYRFGYASEETLVTSLARQFGFPPVCLSGITIDRGVIRMIPADLARSCLILPFFYDKSGSLLKIACENPRRSGLDQELRELLPGIRVERYVAIADTLRAAIVSHYRDAVVISESPPTRDIPASGSVSVPIDQLVSLSAACRVLLIRDNDTDVPALRPVLLHQGFVVTECVSPHDLRSTFESAKPDILVLVGSDSSRLQMLFAEIDSLATAIASCPSFLVMREIDDADIGRLLRIGFEEVVRAGNVLDLLMIKLNRFKERLITQRNQRVELLQALGTHGSLADMNVIDLLQAMGPTGKTARISISAEGRQLTVFIDRGRVMYAECDDFIGPDAVYSAVGWNQGVWSVDPVCPDELPAPNVFSTNEAILLEGCRRLDEHNRATTPPTQASKDSIAIISSLI
ncbi:MAG: DUF4388 domain-containing protein [Candidatus Zixiibacteriota bacterium]